MKKDGKGFFFKGEEMGAKVGDDADYLKQTYGVEMNEGEVREIIKKVLREVAPAAAAMGGGGAMSGMMASLGRAFAGIGGTAARAGRGPRGRGRGGHDRRVCGNALGRGAAGHPAGEGHGAGAPGD